MRRGVARLLGVALATFAVATAFLVSSGASSGADVATDITPPVMTSLSFSTTNIHVSLGEVQHVTVTAHVTDDRSGVAAAWIYAQGADEYRVDLSRVSGTPNDGTWQGTMTVTGHWNMGSEISIGIVDATDVARNEFRPDCDASDVAALGFPNSIGLLVSFGQATSSGAVIGDVRVIGPSGSSVSGVSTLPLSASSGVAPIGSLSYQLSGVPKGATETVALQLPQGSSPTAAYKLAGGEFVPLASGVKISGDTINLQVVDGGAGDEDGIANGVIVDPVVPMTSGLPFTVPRAPNLLSTTVGDTSISISWSAPAFDGGSPVTGYTASATDGSHIFFCTTQILSCAITHLTNGVRYSVSVTALNAAGRSPNSTIVNAAPVSIPRAPTVPLAPSAPSVTPLNASVDVNWSASGDGGSPITGYRATASPGGQSCISINVTGCRITGLSNGVGYTVSVVAANAFGSSQAATTSSFWPVPGVAYAVYPTDAIVKAGSPTSAVVSGAPPATTVSVTLAKGKASCLTTPAGQCLATFASSSPSLAAATAKCKSGKATLSASSATKVAVPKAKLPTSIKRLKTLTLSVSSALPGSTVRLSLVIGTTNVSAQAVADSAGVSILTMVVPNKAGTATLTLTDGGVAVASGSLAIT